MYSDRQGQELQEKSQDVRKMVIYGQAIVILVQECQPDH